MSGGHFNYDDSRLKSTIFDYGDKVSNQFEDSEISRLVWDVLDLIHEYDWYISGDTGKQDYLKAKREFKKKWLRDNNTETLTKIIDEEVEKLRGDLKEML